jgi:phosphoglycolate phosphatase
VSFRTFLFDLDGTLIDSAPDICRVANIALKEVNRAPLPVDIVRSFVGDGLPALIQRVLNHSDARPIDSAVLDPDEHQRATQIAKLAYEESPVIETIIYPNVPQTLSQLHQNGATLGLITNKPYLVTTRILQHLNLDTLFSIVLGGDSLPERKPSPVPITKALSQLQREPSTTLFVGDHANDFHAARGANTSIALVSYGYTPEAQLASLHPDFLLADPLPLIQLCATG